MTTINYTKEELETRYRKLPEILRDALLSVEVANKIFETAKKHGLPAQKISRLAEEVGYVILGLTKPQEFIPKLIQTVEVDSDKAKTIAKEINHQIFFPLREELKKTHEMDMTEEEIERGAAMMRAPTPPAPPRPPAPPLPAQPPTPTAPPQQQMPSPTPTPPRPPQPIEEKKAPPLPPPPVFPPKKIVLEKKPEPPSPPPKIPPIDLRNQKPPTPPPMPPPRNTKYEESDPYREPPEGSV